MAEFVKMQQAAQAAGGLGIDGMNMSNSQEMIAKMQKARKVSCGHGAPQEEEHRPDEGRRRLRQEAKL